MKIKRRHVRKAAGVGATIVAFPVIVHLLILVAEQFGAYHGASPFAALLSTPAFHWLGGGVFGFAAGVWVVKLMNASDPTFVARPAESPTTAGASATRLNFAEVEAEAVGEGLILKLNLAIFNGSARALVVKELSGFVQYRPLGSQAEFQKLTKASLIDELQAVPAFGESIIGIVQPAAGALSEEMFKCLDGPGLELELSDLDIILMARGSRRPDFRIPIWSRLAVHKQKTRQYTDRAPGDAPQLMKEWLQPRP